MESELRQILRDELVKAQPQIKSDLLYTRCVNNYVDAMALEICRALALNVKGWNIKDNEFAFSAVRAKHAAKRTGVPQQYNYHLMQKNLSTALLLESSKGFSNKGSSQLSVMRINPIYEDLLMEELLNLKLERNQRLLDDIEQNYTHVIDLDIASLRCYINKTKQDIAESKKGQHYSNALLRNLAAAQQLMAMAHEADASNPHSAYVRERYETADSGRIYGQGYSLQRMNKRVRDAALGVCHKYDFQACAFAVMASVAHAINPTLKIGAVLDYIRDRTKIRKRIATQTGISVELVKEIFTALGFGAELKNNPYNAIRGALAKAARKQHDTTVRLDKEVWNNLGADAYARLIGDQTFMFIYEDLQQINTTILRKYSDDDIVIGNAVYSAIDPNAHKLDKYGKRKKKSDYRTNEQKLAWIYQALETLAREEFEKLSGQKALLTTHDCIYFKQKLPINTVLDITYELQQTFPYLCFEHEAIYPIADQQTFDNRFAEADAYEREHKEWIKEQEAKARDYLSATGINVAVPKQRSIQTENEYEMTRRAQFMRDVGITTYDVGSTKGERADYEYNYEYEYAENTKQLSECVAD
jgi:hypothetical protein